MEQHIPNTFDNFEQKISNSNKLETISTTEYKGYQIRLRCYTGSGISAKIYKETKEGKKIWLREESWTWFEPIKLLNKMKTYIDNHEINLINKLNKKLRNTSTCNSQI